MVPETLGEALWGLEGLAQASHLSPEDAVPGPHPGEASRCIYCRLYKDKSLECLPSPQDPQ